MTEPSTTLGRYIIQAELGKGGFATVFRALDTSLNREVALKILHPQLLADRTFVDRFRKEARTLASLRHAHIVTIYEVSEAEGRVFIAMELAHGSSLAQAIADRKRLPWTETLAILKPVTEALDYAHGQGVIHRDLKPANILLDSERGPLLTDFGFARLMGDSSVSMSLSGGILGTPAYIAPEVWELDTATAAVDIYALGCIAYEMVSGEVLFSGKTPMQTMRAHDRGPQFNLALPGDVPQSVAQTLQVALARQPEARYPSASALWHALNDLEANAQAEREQAERQAIADQWKAEVESAMADRAWSAAKMAVGRWLAITPENAQAIAARGEIEKQIEQMARGRMQEAEAARKAEEERQRLAAEEKKKQEAAAQSTAENARQETVRKAEEQERQATIAAQEKAKREAQAAAVAVDADTMPEGNATNSTSSTLTVMTAVRAVPRKLFIMPTLSLIMTVLGTIGLTGLRFDLVFGPFGQLLLLYYPCLVIWCAVLLVRLIRDSRRGIKDHVTACSLDKSPRAVWKLFIQWMIVNALGALGVYFAVVFDIFGTILAVGLMGILQWLIVRKYVDLWGYWSITYLPGAIALFLTAWFGFLGSFSLILILLGTTVVGLAQWLILRHRVYRAGWWILANIIGWGALIFRLSYDITFSGITASLFFGFLTGIILIWLLRHPKPVN